MKPIRATLLLLLAGLFPGGGLSAQSAAARMDVLLESQAVTWEDAAGFILDAAGVAYGALGAFEYCRTHKWLPQSVHYREPITMQGFSLLAMSAFEMNGGLMYTLTHSSRYAYRELLYRNILPPRSDPALYLSGETFLYVLARILMEQGRYDA